MDTPKESIFITSLKSFLKGFFVVLGILFAFIPVILIFSGLFGSKDIIPSKNIVQILPDLEGNTMPLPEKTPAILQIDIQGVIGKGEMQKEQVKQMLLESRQHMFKKDRVKAILLNINTPGGAVFDGEGIYNALISYKKKYKVPIYAIVEGLNASCGMWISCCADKIYATEMSLVGSIGAFIGPFFNVSKLFDKIGMEGKFVYDGKNKVAMTPFHPWGENEDENYKKIVGFIYEKFLDLMVTSRPKLSKEKLISTYGANVYPAPIAERYGYIDNGNSSYEECLKDLLQAAKIDEKKPYQVVKMKPKRKWMEELFESSALFKGKIKHQIDMSPKSENGFDIMAIYNPSK